MDLKTLIPTSKGDENSNGVSNNNDEAVDLLAGYEIEYVSMGDDILAPGRVNLFYLLFNSMLQNSSIFSSTLLHQWLIKLKKLRMIKSPLMTREKMPLQKQHNYIRKRKKNNCQRSRESL